LLSSNGNSSATVESSINELLAQKNAVAKEKDKLEEKLAALQDKLEGAKKDK
jgi:hypothetical protein